MSCSGTEWLSHSEQCWEISVVSTHLFTWQNWCAWTKLKKQWVVIDAFSQLPDVTVERGGKGMGRWRRERRERREEKRKQFPYFMPLLIFYNLTTGLTEMLKNSNFRLWCRNSRIILLGDKSAIIFQALSELEGTPATRPTIHSLLYGCWWSRIC